MSRYWEIRESYGEKKRGTSEETREAYECGYDDGYQDAMREMQEKSGARYGMRNGYSATGEQRMHDDGYGERRSRDSYGRYR